MKGEQEHGPNNDEKIGRGAEVCAEGKARPYAMGDDVGNEPLAAR